MKVEIYLWIAWKVSKYGDFSGPYFPVFRLKYSPNLDTFHAVLNSMHVNERYLVAKYSSFHKIIETYSCISKWNVSNFVTKKYEKHATVLAFVAHASEHVLSLQSGIKGAASGGVL